MKAILFPTPFHGEVQGQYETHSPGCTRNRHQSIKPRFRGFYHFEEHLRASFPEANHQELAARPDLNFPCQTVLPPLLHFPIYFINSVGRVGLNLLQRLIVMFGLLGQD